MLIFIRLKDEKTNLNSNLISYQEQITNFTINNNNMNKQDFELNKAKIIGYINNTTISDPKFNTESNHKKPPRCTDNNKGSTDKSSTYK